MDPRRLTAAGARYAPSAQRAPTLIAAPVPLAVDVRDGGIPFYLLSDKRPCRLIGPFGTRRVSIAASDKIRLPHVKQEVP